MDKGRPRLQRSASARGALQRSNSLIRLLGRVPWASNDDEYFSSSEEEVVAPPSPAVSLEDAKVGLLFAMLLLKEKARFAAYRRAAVLLVLSGVRL